MTQICHSCSKPAIRRCAGCKVVTAWYCSRECQKSHWVVHIFDCNPRRAITPADHLALAVYARNPPTNAKTCTDLRFDRTVGWESRAMLFELYATLVNELHISPKMIYSWSTNDMLAQEIHSSFQKVPEGTRGPFYDWFLENQQVFKEDRVDEESMDDLINELYKPACDYAGFPGSYTAARRMEMFIALPKDMSGVLFICGRIIAGSFPPPDNAMWMAFGFCTCKNLLQERQLCALYGELFERCPFEEFWYMFGSGSITKLFDAHGLKAEREQYFYLDDIMGGHASERWRSVWYLKQLVRVSTVMDLPSKPDEFKINPFVATVSPTVRLRKRSKS